MVDDFPPPEPEAAQDITEEEALARRVLEGEFGQTDGAIRRRLKAQGKDVDLVMKEVARLK